MTVNWATLYQQSQQTHYSDVITSVMASQVTSVSIVYSVCCCSGTDQRKHQSSASLASVWGIHQWPVHSPHKGPVTRKMFPFDVIIINEKHWLIINLPVIISILTQHNKCSPSFIDIVNAKLGAAYQCWVTLLQRNKTHGPFELTDPRRCCCNSKLVNIQTHIRDRYLQFSSKISIKWRCHKTSLMINQHCSGNGLVP